VSTSRAKKKRRRRAAGAGGGAAALGGGAGAAGAGAAGAGAAGAGGAGAAGAGGAGAGAAGAGDAGAAGAGGGGAARGGGEPGASVAGGGRGLDGRRGGATEEPVGRPSRFEVRDGVARPDAIWSPFPLTEIGMAVGLVIFLAGFASDGRRATWLLSVGVIVLAVVVGELCLREHFAGFRSHTLLLAGLPVAIAHVVVTVAITDAWAGPLALAVDLALAAALAWVLHARFRAAHERARGPRERVG
jgi:hypothetical protein